MANPIVTSLPAFIKQDTGLIAKTVLSAKTAKLFNLMPGVKGSASLNDLVTDIQFGDGSNCGWNAAGSTTITQRVLETKLVKVNMPFCDKNLIGKFAEHEVRIAAGVKTLPFEEEFTNDIVDNTGVQLDKAIWQGDTGSSVNNLKYFDGMLKILNAASGVNKVGGTKANPEADIQLILDSIAANCPEILEKDDVVIFCAPSFQMKYAQALVAKNLYHYKPNEVLDDIIIPGTNIRLVSVGGLTGSSTHGNLVAGRKSNFYFGCDTAEDSSEFDFWYSKDAGEFRLKIEFNAGVQVAYPDQVVLATFTD